MKPASRKVIDIAVGLAGLATSALPGLPLLLVSLLVGLSLGLVLVSVFGDKIPAPALTRRAEERVSLDKVLVAAPTSRTEEKVVVKPGRRSAEITHALDSFDELLPALRRTHDEGAGANVAKDFNNALDKLNSIVPEWDGEGRLRTYVVLQAIARSIDAKNADSFLNMVYKTMQVRNGEAAELSRTLLKDKLEKMYVDPDFENTSHITGTLILMNREDSERVKEILMDAIHLWSESKFKNLKLELGMVNKIAETVKPSIVEMLEKEVSKAKKANDATALSRAKEVLRLAEDSGPEPSNP